MIQFEGLAWRIVTNRATQAVLIESELAYYSTLAGLKKPRYQRIAASLYRCSSYIEEFALAWLKQQAQGQVDLAALVGKQGNAGIAPDKRVSRLDAWRRAEQTAGRSIL